MRWTPKWDAHTKEPFRPVFVGALGPRGATRRASYFRHANTFPSFLTSGLSLRDLSNSEVTRLHYVDDLLKKPHAWG